MKAQLRKIMNICTDIAAGERYTLEGKEYTISRLMIETAELYRSFIEEEEAQFPERLVNDTRVEELRRAINNLLPSRLEFVEQKQFNLKGIV